ncbi:MAG TPA: ABC transporter ATP-binding protein, partial [Candidatus Babeliales bacterium]|nr:ABC transporter ATP-binding protein [Candidatus Babeliales bacterium]
MDNRTKARRVFGYYWKKVKAYPLSVAGLLVVVPVTVLMNSYLPTLILAQVLSRLSTNDYQPHQIWSSFGLSIVLYFVTIMAGLVLWRVVDNFAWKLEGNIQKDIAEEVLDHLLDESADFHANNFSGSLVSQTNKLLSGYVRIADTTIFNAIQLLSGILFSTLILLPRAPLFALLLIALSAVFILVAFKVSKPVRDLNAIAAGAESRQTGYLADAITNVIAVKSFVRGEYERQRFARATTETRIALWKLATAHKKQMNYLGFLSRSMNAWALVRAIVSVMVFSIDIATVFLIFSYTASIADQLFGFSNNGLRNYNRSVGDAFDMVETLSKYPAVQDPVDPEKPEFKLGHVEFKAVEFDHDNNGQARSRMLFRDFNLDIPPGEKIGLVGHSGGGKTTLTKLILRFMDIAGGEISIDGQNIAHVTQDDLRQAIAYVPQDPLLFHRSLAENIAYGKPKAHQSEVISAAKMAHADDFIKDLPNGYETLVGERGIKLSGGQRQRIAIARAMLKDAPILVLDEATSALDSESEKLIQAALWKLMEGRTALVIA